MGSVLTTHSGDSTEAAVLKALVAHGHRVLLPFSAWSPYDLLIDATTTFVRVQCKTGREGGGCVLFISCSTDHGRGRQDYRGRADVLAVFCPTLDQVYVVPVEECATRVTRLRLQPTRNGQRRRVRSAEHYEVACWRPSAAPSHSKRGREPAQPR